MKNIPAILRPIKPRVTRWLYVGGRLLLTLAIGTYNLSGQTSITRPGTPIGGLPQTPVSSGGTSGGASTSSSSVPVEAAAVNASNSGGYTGTRINIPTGISIPATGFGGGILTPGN